MVMVLGVVWSLTNWFPSSGLWGDRSGSAHEDHAWTVVVFATVRHVKCFHMLTHVLISCGSAGLDPKP